MEGYMASTKTIFVKITYCRAELRRHYQTVLEGNVVSGNHTLREAYPVALNHSPYRRRVIDIEGVDNLKSLMVKIIIVRQSRRTKRTK